DRDFLLASSLKAFLNHVAIALVELEKEKPLMEFIEAGELKQHWATIALMKWEIHHGFKIDVDKALELSIEQMVDHVLNKPLLTVEEYMDHTLKRLDEIEDIFEKHQYDDSDFDEEEFDREYYLGNSN
ncbi:MAG: hypothetical protein WDZ80_04535, partial [Candidatus Paceibacterota bacterium]